MLWIPHYCSASNFNLASRLNCLPGSQEETWADMWSRAWVFLEWIKALSHFMKLHLLVMCCDHLWMRERAELIWVMAQTHIPKELDGIWYSLVTPFQSCFSCMTETEGRVMIVPRQEFLKCSETHRTHKLPARACWAASEHVTLWTEMSKFDKWLPCRAGNAVLISSLWAKMRRKLVPLEPSGAWP